ncbi:TetR/AcrR family transcriptional regulator [Streptomyces sp. NPDC049687]|uniref:TetR/AcrR family transcriptional regulator n=1 Tax=Streptomyces sp. NPDC049687 TaxID=3365596 RepID=UPI003788F121
MSTAAPPRNRFERRRAETRQALIRAARELLAEHGGGRASIQSIADRADVGFGYDHLQEVVDDPAEPVAAGFRLTARMGDSHPELVQILRHRGLRHIHSERGVAPRALRDLQRGITTGRFADADPVAALSAMGGVLLSLVELRIARPDLDSEEAASKVRLQVVQQGVGQLPRERRAETLGAGGAQWYSGTTRTPKIPPWSQGVNLPPS